MTLSPEDGRLFFNLMWKLQFYVNQKRGFHNEITTRDEYANLPTQKKLVARDALWEIDGLIESYVRENPDTLPPEELAIVQAWTGFVKDTFIILRHLKKGSIFLGSNEKVYSVHGIQDSLEEVIPPQILPRRVIAVLLPFKGRIIYDGLLQGYNIHFGAGIRSSLDHAYAVAKQKDRVIVTLEPNLTPPKIAQPKNSLLPQMKELTAALAKIKGNGALQNSSLSLARLCLVLSVADAEGKIDPVGINSHGNKIFKASKRLLNLLELMEEDS